MRSDVYGRWVAGGVAVLLCAAAAAQSWEQQVAAGEPVAMELFASAEGSLNVGGVQVAIGPSKGLMLEMRKDQPTTMVFVPKAGGMERLTIDLRHLNEQPDACYYYSRKAPVTVEAVGLPPEDARFTDEQRQAGATAAAVLGALGKLTEKAAAAIVGPATTQEARSPWRMVDVYGVRMMLMKAPDDATLREDILVAELPTDGEEPCELRVGGRRVILIENGQLVPVARQLTDLLAGKGFTVEFAAAEGGRSVRITARGQMLFILPAVTDPYEKLAIEMIDIYNTLAEELAKVTDLASAEAQRERLVELMKRLRACRQAVREMGPPDRKRDLMIARRHGKEAAKATGRYKQQLYRLAVNEEVVPVMRQIFVRKELLSPEEVRRMEAATQPSSAPASDE